MPQAAATLGGVSHCVALIALGAVACGPQHAPRQCRSGFVESAVVRSAADIEALADVDEIEELRIEESDLRDLRGFECVTRLGDLYIERNAELESLDGFDGLVETVGPAYGGSQGSAGEFFIRQNSALVEVEGFEALTSVDGILEISGNSSLREIHGFDSVRLVRAEVAIADNPELEVVAAFGAFEGGDVVAEGAGGSLRIERNPRLGRVSMGADAPVLAHLRLRDNPELTEFDVRVLCSPVVYLLENNQKLAQLPTSVRPQGSEEALCSNPRVKNWYSVKGMALSDLGKLPLRAGTDSLEVSDNPNLRTLEGLNALEAVGEFRLTGNQTLESLAALDPTEQGALAVVGTIVVRDNDALGTCQVDRLVEQLLPENPELETDIDGNATECP